MRGLVAVFTGLEAATLPVVRWTIGYDPPVRRVGSASPRPFARAGADVAEIVFIFFFKMTRLPSPFSASCVPSPVQHSLKQWLHLGIISPRKPFRTQSVQRIFKIPEFAVLTSEGFPQGKWEQSTGRAWYLMTKTLKNLWRQDYLAVSRPTQEVARWVRSAAFFQAQLAFNLLAIILNGASR